MAGWLDAMQGFAVIGIVIAVGYAAARMRVGGSQAQMVLNRMSFFVATPCLIFSILSRERLTTLLHPSIVVAFVAALTVGALFLLCNRLWVHLRAPDAAIGALGALYLNSTNIGLPVATYILGNPAQHPVTRAAHHAPAPLDCGGVRGRAHRGRAVPAVQPAVVPPARARRGDWRTRRAVPQLEQHRAAGRLIHPRQSRARGANRDDAVAHLHARRPGGARRHDARHGLCARDGATAAQTADPDRQCARRGRLGNQCARGVRRGAGVRAQPDRHDRRSDSRS